MGQRVKWPTDPEVRAKLFTSLWYDAMRHPRTQLVGNDSDATGKEEYEWWIKGQSGEAVRPTE